MHLQQTKRKSRETGGPQYYFHNLSEGVKTFLRKKGAVSVALITPYGATKTSFYAISKDHKFNSERKITKGSVGHDRIQQGSSDTSIGEAIRYWYNLPSGDFERIDVEIDIIDDSFYLTPINYKTPFSKRQINLTYSDRSLTFTKDYISKFWKDHINYLLEKDNGFAILIMEAHKEKVAHIQETDLLRASGPLGHLGISLGPYVGKGYDCISDFHFMNYPSYIVPVEIKKFSKNFIYQMQKYGKDELSRAVILCAFHDIDRVHRHIDVIELDALGNYQLHR